MPSGRSRLLLALAVLLSSASLPAATPPAGPALPTASVLQFAPQGELESVRQVTARFSADMIRLGDPHVRNPFIVDCVAKGRGRWVDTRNWAYDFEADVPRGHSCGFTLVKGLKTVGGQVVAGKARYGFNTSPLAEAPTVKAAAGKTVLEFFTPQGETRGVRQVQTRFSEPMIRLGDPKVYNPFTVLCPQKGKGRWVDTRNWVYDFEKDLPSGLACEFNLVAGLKSVAGRPVTSFPKYRFNTGAPSAVDARPYVGDHRIDENQTFLVKFDGELDRMSLPKATYCLVEGIKEKIPARFLTTPETEAFVAKLPEEMRRWWAERTAYANEGRRAVLEWRALSCARQLPPGSKVKLVFAAGLASKQGVASTVDQSFDFQVRPNFTAEFSCTRENARQACAPVANMRLNFTDMVDASQLKAIRLEGGGRTWMPVPNAEGDEFESGSTAEFQGPFPPETSFVLRLPPRFADDSGRPLVNAARFPLAVKTGPYPPLAKFAADFGVIERAAGAVPLTVRNLEPGQGVTTEAKLYTFKLPDADAALLQWLKRVREHQSEQSCYNCGERDDNGRLKKPDPRTASLLKGVQDVQMQPLPKKLGAKEFEVIGLPVPNAGVYVHEVESSYLGASLVENKAPMFVSAMSVVTNLGVHLRQGAEGSLVWVTTLDKAQPVAGADVAIWSCDSKKAVWRGRTDAQGIARIEKQSTNWADYGDCMGSKYVVIARSAGDRAIVLPNWSEGIESWRFNLPGYTGSGTLVAHSVLDRSLFRAGETVHMRHVLRELSLTGLRAPKGRKFESLQIVHEGSGQKYDLPLNIDAQGNGENNWAIPRSAKLGSYSIRLSEKAKSRSDEDEGDYDDSRTLAQFRVEEFRLPVLKATLQLPAGPVVAPSSVPVDMQLQYLNGGAYGEVPVTLRGRVRSVGVNFDGLDEYNFGISSDEGGSDNDENLEEQAVTLDAKGGARAQSRALPARHQVSELYLEMEYSDPSGETQTAGTRTRLWPSAILPGIKVPSWVSANADEGTPIDIVTVGTSGKLQGNVPVTVTAKLHTRQSHRKRTVGGFYAYETVEKDEDVPVQCGNRTDASGRMKCKVVTKVSGELNLRVTSRDPQGRAMTAGTSVWVSGGERWWFDQGNDDRIDLIPEKKNYEAGETMRLQLRMPFPEATALISIERDGVIESFVQTIKSSKPVIELPVKADYAPNVFVSAFVLRGRNNEVAPTALIDLGKPAFKLGIAEVKVGWNAYRLGVEVKTDRTRYKPREKAQVDVQVNPPAGQTLPAGTEVALAAVDEALLELAGNDTWDVLTPMMLERGHGVETATSQLQVVGKRHYGKKALPPGGGGGGGRNTRELFDTLLYWQGRAKVDANGHAQFSVPLNDSLSGFRVVAVAISENRFGTGQTRMESFQDVQLVSGLPLLVRQGDKLAPGFTVRNASDRVQTLNFKATIEGLGTQLERQITVQPGKAELVTVPVSVPQNVDALKWTVGVEGANGGDRLSITQRVLDAVPERVLQAQLQQLDQPLEIPVQKPKAALPGGALVVSGRARLGDSLDTVREYFRNYPFACLEQKTSKSVGLQDEKLWAETMELLPAYIDDKNLAAFWPEGRGYPFLSAYVLNVSQALGWKIPKDSRERLLKGLTDYAEGRTEFEDWHYSEWDDTQRRLEVLTVLAKYGKFKPAQLESLKIDPPRWSAQMLVDWLDLLRASPQLPKRAERLVQAESLLRSRLTLQGTTLQLSEGRYSRWWLYDNDEVTTARLILATLDLPAWREDQPRLLRGLITKQREGHWNTTVANLWGGIALKRFSEKFESVPVAGRTELALAGKTAALEWTANIPEPARLDWPQQPATLKLSQNGSGKPWITVQSRARLPITQPMSTGFTVKKTITAVQQKVAGQWSAGDVVRVRLDMEAQSDIGWVAVDDPIPAGSTLLGRALAKDSELATSGERSSGAWPSYAEFAADAYRAFYENIYKGEWSVEYTLRLNQSGDFKLPATRLEAMYAPEMFGMTPNPVWTVKP